MLRKNKLLSQGHRYTNSMVWFPKRRLWLLVPAYYNVDKHVSQSGLMNWILPNIAFDDKGEVPIYVAHTK